MRDSGSVPPIDGQDCRTYLCAVDACSQALADEYEPLVAEARRLLADTLRLEARVQRLVFHLYDLTPDEVTLLRASAPPRDPLTLAEADARTLGLDLGQSAPSGESSRRWAT